MDYGSAADWQWVGNIEAVQFTVCANGEPIVCRVSKECIADNCGNPTTPESLLDDAKRHFEPITDRVGDLIGRGRFEEVEPRKIVLLRSSAW